MTVLSVRPHAIGADCWCIRYIRRSASGRLNIMHGDALSYALNLHPNHLVGQSVGHVWAVYQDGAAVHLVPSGVGYG